MGRYYYRGGKTKKTHNNQGMVLLISHLDSLNLDQLDSQKIVYEEQLKKIINFFDGKEIKIEEEKCNNSLIRLKPLLSELVRESKVLGDEAFYDIKKTYFEEKRWFSDNYVKLHIRGYAKDESKGDKFLKIARSIADICDEILEYSNFCLNIYEQVEKILKEHEVWEYRDGKKDTYDLNNNDFTIKDRSILWIYHGRFSEIQQSGETGLYKEISKNFSKFFINFMADSTNDYKDWGPWVKQDMVDYVPSSKPDETHHYNESNFMKQFLEISKHFDIPYSVKRPSINDKKKAIEVLEKFLRRIELIFRASIKGKEKMENVGYVYVLSNEAYPNIYKIGSTYGLPEERAEELTGTGHLTPFKVVGKIRIKSAEYYEKSIHKLLNEYRVKQGREFFKLDLDKIKDCLKQVFEISRKGEKKITLSELKLEIRL
tara:strand:- start:700 stop:1986 length:1287 start_codon:yes stop_codon:yes gene_type:complete